MTCLQCSLQDIFRNQSVSSDVEAVELACDGVIMDMAYCPDRFVIFVHYIYSAVTSGIARVWCKEGRKTKRK